MLNQWPALSNPSGRVRSGRLAEILRHQAALLEQITTEQRYYPEYFRVTYYGNFPTAVRSKPLIVSRFHTMVTNCSSSLSVPRLRVGEVWCILRAHAQQASWCTTAQVQW